MSLDEMCVAEQMEILETEDTYEEMEDVVGTFLTVCPEYTETLKLYESAASPTDFSSQMINIFEALIMLHFYIADENNMDEDMKTSIVCMALSAAGTIVCSLVESDENGTAPPEAHSKEYYNITARRAVDALAKYSGSLKVAIDAHKAVHEDNADVREVTVRPDVYALISQGAVREIVRPATFKLDCGEVIKITTVHDGESHVMIAMVPSVEHFPTFASAAAAAELNTQLSMGISAELTAEEKAYEIGKQMLELFGEEVETKFGADLVRILTFTKSDA